jgi:SAM-dependent methyltransferase
MPTEPAEPQPGAPRQAHWDRAYAEKGEAGVSWFQASPDPSLEIIHGLAGARPRRDLSLIDIGGGASRLVDALLAEGWRDLAVLDLSAEALEAARVRLAAAAAGIDWIRADVTEWQPARRYDVWHDRAAFHFLTEAADRARYRAALLAALKPGGHAIIATFAPDGPERCSGLPVCRYDAPGLAAEIGPGFSLAAARHHLHQTPWGSSQSFQFSVLQRAVSEP